MACDMRIAGDDAKFGIPIARTLGNTLSAQNLSRLVALVGPARAKELIFTARFMEAAEGKAVGLFNEVVGVDQLEIRIRELAMLIAGHAPLTICLIKEGVWRLQVHSRIDETNDLYLMCYLSEDFKEGVSAFMLMPVNDDTPPTLMVSACLTRELHGRPVLRHAAGRYGRGCVKD